MVAGVEPNAENKLFVGGCPPGSGEEDLRVLFEKHGRVEEVFVMRGGSRSGMACAFVRFAEQQMAQDAIDAIHGQHTLPNSAEPLVVRWADAPGSRKKDAREGGRKHRNVGGGVHRGDGGWGNMMQMGFASAHAAYGAYPQMGHMSQMQHQAGFGGGGFYGSQGAAMDGNFRGGDFNGMMPFHPQMMPYMDMSQANMAGCWPSGPPSPGQGSMMGSMMPGFAHGAYAPNVNVSAPPMATAQRGA